MDSSQIIFDTISKIAAIFSIMETAVGIILNPLVLIIILKSKRLRSTSTFKILAVNAVNDMLVGIAWNQENFTSVMFNYYASFSNLFFCRWIASFLQQTTLCIETWLILIISVDRLLSMMVKKWSKFYFSGYRPYILAVSLCFLIAGLNFHLVFTSGYSFYNNATKTEIVVCFATDPSYGYNWYEFGALFTLYFGFLVPVGILLIVNVLIILKATQYSRAQKAQGNTNTTNVESEKRKAQMTRMILFLTFFFVLVSLPQKICSGYFLNVFFTISSGTMLIVTIDALQFFYPTFHFFILYFSNKQFAAEVKEILMRIKISSSSHAMSSSITKLRNNNRVSSK